MPTSEDVDGEPWHVRCWETAQEAEAFADIPTGPPVQAVQAAPDGADLGQIERWLTFLYGQEPDGLIWIGGHADGWKGRTFTTPADAARYAVELDNRNGIGVYHRLTTLARVPEKRGNVDDSATVTALAMDLDLAGPNHKGTDYPPTAEALIDLLAAAGLPEPTAWVNSGGGRYPYWLLTDPASVRDDAARSRVRDLSRQWHEHVIAVADGKGWKVDNTSDLARVYRLPGTTNRKTSPVLARVLDMSGPRYTLADLESVLASVATPPARERKTPTGNQRDGFDDLFSSPPNGGGKALDARVQELCDELARAGSGANELATRIAFMVGQYAGAGQLSTWEAQHRLESALVGWTYEKPGDRETMLNTIARQIDEGFKSPRAWELPHSSTVTNPPAFADFDDPEGPTPLEAMLARFVNREQAKDIPPPKWLVRSMFHQTTLARISGHPGDGKSFVALDLACHIATGQDWHGRKVEKGRVVYLAAEGLSGLALRLQAWERHHGLEVDDLLIYPEAVQVVSENWPLFVECCKRLGADLIVIDTQARVTVGVQENDNSDMGKVVERLDPLRRVTGATVLLIHHLTKNGESSRGAGAVWGAMDTELVVSMNKTTRVITIKVEKQKDVEEGEPVSFTLTGVPLGLDEEGEQLSSAVLIPSAARVRTDEDRLLDQLPATRIRVLDLLALHSPTLGATRPELKRFASPEISGATVHRAVDDLVRFGALVQEGQRFFLSENEREKRSVFTQPEGT